MALSGCKAGHLVLACGESRADDGCSLTLEDNVWDEEKERDDGVAFSDTQGEVLLHATADIEGARQCAPRP